MSKTVGIDLSGDRLIGIAADLVDEHNYIRALKMLNKNAEISGNDEDSYMLYAEIFDDIGLYEKSVNNWFRYLDITQSDELGECYEGLAVDYMNLGNDHFSAYYYNKLLLETDEVDSEMREQIIKDFLTVEDNPLKFAWPPEIADVGDIMQKGISLMADGKFKEAYDTFGEVAEGNPKWPSARNYMAMCLIVDDKSEEAEAECMKVLAARPDDVQALVSLAAVKTEAGKKDEAVALAKKLIALDLKDNDSIYKAATVCCENSMHEEAYSLFCKLDDIKYDLSLMFFKAVSAFNCGKVRESYDHFDSLLTVHPDAVTARYYYSVARSLEEEGKKAEIPYYYRLPQEIRQSSLKTISALMKLNSADFRKALSEIDVFSLVLWCFDEDAHMSEELKALAVHVAIRARFEDFLRDALLNAFIADRIKIDALAEIGRRNEENAFGVVVCNVYKRITFRKLFVGRKRRKSFVEACSRLISHFSIIDNAHGERFYLTAERIYGRAERLGNLEKLNDTDILTALVFAESGVREAGINDGNLCAFFDVDEGKLSKYRSLI